MNVEQIKTLMQNITKEVIGETDIVAEDLSNVVDIGKAIFNATDVDNYVKTLVDHIGKVWVQDRKLTGLQTSIYRDSWEYGSVMQKIYCNTIPEAVDNKTWDLVDGTSYDPNVFKKPSVTNKFFNNKSTFEIDLSITDRQAKESLDNVTQLNAFTSMLYGNVDNSANLKMDSIAQRIINSLIAYTLYDEFPQVQDGDYSAVTGTKAVNLLKLYNDRFNASLTPEGCIYNPEFIRFAVFTMSLYQSRIKKASKLFNCDNIVRATPTDKQHLILLSEFKKAADIYLQSDTYNEQYTKLPMAEDVPYWQGSGTDYSFAKTSDIHINVEDPANASSSIEITASGILGVLFDHDACGLTNESRRVTSNYNPKAEFTNLFYKFDMSTFVDTSENCVVFFVA